MSKQEHINYLMGIGISDVDADTVYDCIATREVCTWTSVDAVPDDTEQKVNEYLKPYGLELKIIPVGASGRYIWEVKKTRA
ncbi:MAG: hypothetical protein N3G76_03070 [Candidatus Micrarchaeota archaeon]|nr:hypothetical protein [Candidatus Micrarchaeota archaeon]